MLRRILRRYDFDYFDGPCAHHSLLPLECLPMRAPNAVLRVLPLMRYADMFHASCCLPADTATAALSYVAFFFFFFFLLIVTRAPLLMRAQAARLLLPLSSTPMMPIVDIPSLLMLRHDICCRVIFILP